MLGKEKVCLNHSFEGSRVQHGLSPAENSSGGSRIMAEACVSKCLILAGGLLERQRHMGTYTPFMSVP